MHRADSSAIIMVEGNIGAGKSTFLKIIEKSLNVDVIFEPTNKWQHPDDEQNLLHLFYKDTRRWAYTFQSYAFISRVQTILNHQKQTKTNKIQVLERSVYCDRYCFAKNCFDAGLMSPIEWQVYREWFSWLAEKYTPIPRGFIYLRTDPKTCYNRILKRNRHEEDVISKSYLQALHERHEDWLIKQKDLTPHLQAIPVLILDCNEEFETNIEIQEKYLLSIKDFIEEKITPVIPATIEPIQSRL